MTHISVQGERRLSPTRYNPKGEPTSYGSRITDTTRPARPATDDPAAKVWDLVERAQLGEAEAFGQIYDHYVATVYRFIHFRIGNRQVAEDLTADTFLKALRNIGRLVWQGRDPGAWIITIARNLVADHFKSGRYRLEVTVDTVNDDDLRASARHRTDTGPESTAIEHITNLELRDAVKTLEPDQQDCIVLRFFMGFTVSETAQAMGKTEGAVKALQYRAVRTLGRTLPDELRPTPERGY